MALMGEPIQHSMTYTPLPLALKPKRGFCRQQCRQVQRRNLLDDLISLKNGLNVRVIRDVSHDFRPMFLERRLKFLYGLYPYTRHTNERRGRTIRRNDTFADLALDMVCPKKARDHWDVLFGVIIEVELCAILLRIDHCYAVDHVPPLLCGALLAPS